MESKRKRLLIYYPPNKRAIGLNAVIDLLLRLNVEVFVFTQEPWGQLHEDLKHKIKEDHCLAAGVPQKSGIGFYYWHFTKLIEVCRKHKIDIVFSHLQQGNLVSVVASYLLHNVQFYYFRHHFQYYKKFKLPYLKSGKNELMGEWLVNWLARIIVVPSTTVKDGMIQYEKVNPSKIRLIPYVYNFNEYPSVNSQAAQQIRAKYDCRLLLVMSSRFVAPKRHQLVISILNKLVTEKGYDIKLLLLDEGPLMNSIKAQVSELGLQDRAFFMGYTTNIVDYMAASDLMVHPSVSEASNSSVKEMGMLQRTAVVCRGVGDFDDYIIDKKNGFLIDPLNSEEEMEQAISYAYQNKEQLKEMGSELHKAVVAKFSPGDKVLQLYNYLIEGSC